MDELAAAAAVTAMSIDDFAEEDLEQYAPHEAATVDESQRPAAVLSFVLLQASLCPALHQEPVFLQPHPPMPEPCALGQ